MSARGWDFSDNFCEFHGCSGHGMCHSWCLESVNGHMAMLECRSGWSVCSTWMLILIPIGSMYAIYGNICHQYTPFMLAYIPFGPYMDPMGSYVYFVYLLDPACKQHFRRRNGRQCTANFGRVASISTRSKQWICHWTPRLESPCNWRLGWNMEGMVGWWWLMLVNGD